MRSLSEVLEELVTLVAAYPQEERVDVLNEVRTRLHEVSPLRDQPADLVLWVPADAVQANGYNPNRVASPEMSLLETSVLADGYTMPIVCYPLDGDRYEIVDGFHRNRVGKESEAVRTRLRGRLPLTVIRKPLDERMGSTIRHNRARGTHQIKSMTSIVATLVTAGWSDDDICVKLGMSRDEVLRFKQVSGLREAFADHTFSRSWEEFESNFVEGHVQKLSGVDKTVAVQSRKDGST